jgi:steroid delta-isomerase-like uncharacterized protein
MSAEQHKTIIRRWVEGAWNAGNLALADELYAPDYTYHDPQAPNLPPGPAGIKQLLGGYRAALPDIHMTIEDMIAEGDTVVWRWTARGTHQGDLMGIAPTGKTATVTGIVISRFANGKWAKDHINWDTLGMLQQLGVVPTPGQAP